MSSEERQRTIREQGFRPAEAEREEGARSGREALGRQEAERHAEQAGSRDEPTPVPQEDASKPRPRR